LVNLDILRSFTDNNNVNNLLIWFSAIGFLIAIFPIHIFNYVYINTAERYASINVTAYRYLKLFNVNTVNNSFEKMQINGKEKKLNFKILKKNSYKIFNNLCFYKIIQLTDYGLNNSNNAYVALLQNGMTNAAYSFIKLSGSKTKLKNYTILNQTHDSINYYLKVVEIINLLVLAKIFIILISEKIKYDKNKK
jgi:hypothetical protein